ncbi:uncharacterized protein LOC135474063 [Liolophura sinensis]|uniref:uncharacterized protein LOC135474063 n=1 Tax=Liolophura sinensis TaxID=3198878 RepID=UPI003157FC6A
MQAILKAMGPVGTFLDKVNAELNKKICIVGDLLKVGGKVVSKLKSVEHSISHAIHHIFGRKRVVVMDADFDPRGVRGVDICLSVNQVLHKFKGFTGDMMKQAEKLITDLFHGKVPFHIPSLSNDVLHLGTVLKPFTSGIPKVVMSIAEPLILNAIHMSSNGYVQAIPDCVAAFRG